jgi:hypothetical protein
MRVRGSGSGAVDVTRSEPEAPTGIRRCMPRSEAVLVSR